MTTSESAEAVLRGAVAAALDLPPRARIEGAGTLASAYPVDALATASVAAFADAVTALLADGGPPPGPARVDRGRVSAWFRQALQPVGWTLPSPWDPIAGDYRAADGWIRLHTNAPRHRAAALRVLGVGPDRDAVTAAVSAWAADDLESAIVAGGGCAATMRTLEAWGAHPQGAAVAAEPLIATRTTASGTESRWRPARGRPLADLRVLDLTRVLAGPVATRALAGLGATVLRIDPPDWEEPAVVPEMTLGKRAARLDASTPEGRALLRELLADADVLVHGYRAEALSHLGLGEQERERIRPGLVDVSLTAYGTTGPWSGRRGFDSLVQMSSGIADAGMRWADAERPTPLPVQALDHATGWLMAAAAVEGVRRRLAGGLGVRAELSLARTAMALQAVAGLDRPEAAPAGTVPSSRIRTPWGDADLLDPPFTLPRVAWRFDVGPMPLGVHAPAWA